MTHDGWAVTKKGKLVVETFRTLRRHAIDEAIFMHLTETHNWSWQSVKRKFNLECVKVKLKRVRDDS